jgi:hypothetical protein
MEGEQDAIDATKHTVASFNATVMGFAMKQIYAKDDQYYYARPTHMPIGRGFTLLTDPILRTRED